VEKGGICGNLWRRWERWDREKLMGRCGVGETCRGRKHRCRLIGARVIW